MKKKTLKKIIVTGAVALLVAAICFVIYNVSRTGKVEVFPVSFMADTGMGMDNQLAATISAGKIQKVVLREGLVNSVNVAVGDTVKRGDVLMNYDQTSFTLSLQKSAADIALMESRVAKHRQNADLYRSLIPAEEAPAPTEEIIDHGALDIRATLTADAAESNNAVFLVSPDTVLQKEYLAKLREKKFSVTLLLYQADTLYGTFFIHGKDIPLTVETYEKTEGSNPPVYEKKDVDPLTADWQLKDVIDLSSGTAVVKFDPLLSVYGSFAACKPEKYERYEKKYHNHDIIDEMGNYAYTRAELASMIRAEEKSAMEAEFDLRTARIRYAQDELTAKDGNVLSNIEGTVTEVQDIRGALPGDIVITIKGNENFIVTAYVNEMDLNTVNPGDQISVMAYESGQSTTATIREVLHTPANDRFEYGMANPNSSYYPVEAVVDDPGMELTVGEWCEAALLSEEDIGDAFYIPLMYVRNDLNGMYVYIAENNTLKKQYVTTGKTLWGYEIEILSGLTMEDYIAFPYGKHVHEGAQAVVSENMPMY